MKNLIYIFAIMYLSSCSGSGDTQLVLKQTDQTWKLVKMTGSFMGSETTGSNMEWQETIVLKSNGTFLKSRERDGSIQTATGSYAFSELDDGSYLELKYPSESNLIGNCTGNLIETYWIKSDTELNGTWLACDGPGLHYKLN